MCVCVGELTKAFFGKCRCDVGTENLWQISVAEKQFIKFLLFTEVKEMYERVITKITANKIK
jgi:hypothetical protein